LFKANWNWWNNPIFLGETGQGPCFCWLKWLKYVKIPAKMLPKKTYMLVVTC
jgi:hypothetical protein